MCTSSWLQGMLSPTWGRWWEFVPGVQNIPVQLHKNNTSEALCASESIKVAAIGFQINPCLILTAASVLSVLDPVLAYLLQHTWYKTSESSGAAWQTAGATAKRDIVHILCGLLHLPWSWGPASTCREVKHTCLSRACTHWCKCNTWISSVLGGELPTFS